MTGGDLNVQSGAIFVPAFVGTSTQPNLADPFWQVARQWNNVIDLTGTATNTTGATTFVINNTVWATAGTFSTIPGSTPGSIALVWNPVPEPGHVLLLCGAAAVGVRWWRRRK
jgi:hypothetical protein